MKQDACFDLRMIGADAVPTIALAAELFIESITLRACNAPREARTRAFLDAISMLGAGIGRLKTS